MMLSESPEQVIRDCAPILETGRKLSATETVGDAKSWLEINEIVGDMRTAHHGVGWKKAAGFQRKAHRLGVRWMLMKFVRWKLLAKPSKAAGHAGRPLSIFSSNGATCGVLSHRKLAFCFAPLTISDQRPAN